MHVSFSPPLERQRSPPIDVTPTQQQQLKKKWKICMDNSSFQILFREFSICFCSSIVTLYIYYTILYYTIIFFHNKTVRNFQLHSRKYKNMKEALTPAASK